MNGFNSKKEYLNYIAELIVEGILDHAYVRQRDNLPITGGVIIKGAVSFDDYAYLSEVAAEKLESISNGKNNFNNRRDLADLLLGVSFIPYNREVTLNSSYLFDLRNPIFPFFDSNNEPTYKRI